MSIDVIRYHNRTTGATAVYSCAPLRVTWRSTNHSIFPCMDIGTRWSRKNYSCRCNCKTIRYVIQFIFDMRDYVEFVAPRLKNHRLKWVWFAPLILFSIFSTLFFFQRLYNNWDPMYLIKLILNSILVYRIIIIFRSILACRV